MTTSPVSKYASTTILLIISSVCALFFFLRTIISYPVSSDTYLHLGIGEYILDHRSIPEHSDLSYKIIQPSLEWATRNWLFDLLTYLALSPDIENGSIIVLLFFATLTLVLLNTQLQLVIAPRKSQFSLLVLFLCLATAYWRIHPIVVAIPLLLCAQILYQRWRIGKSGIYYLPLLSLLFANLVGGSIIVLLSFFLLILCYEYVGVPLYANLTNKNTLDPIGNKSKLRMASLLSVGATLINPLGINLYVYGLTTLALLGKNKWYSTLPGVLEVTNTNVFKNTPSTTLYVFFLLYVLFLCIGSVYLLVREHYSFMQSTRFTLYSLPFLFFGFWYIRSIPLSIALTLQLALVITAGLYRKIETKKNWILKSSYKTIGALSLLGCTVLLLFYPPKFLAFSPPKTQCDIIRQNHLPTNVLSSTELVGYLYYCMYPEKQQIEIRDDLFDENDTIGLYSQFSSLPLEEGESILDENGINAVFIGKENDYLSAYFNKNDQFSLVYIDYSGLLFVRDNAVSADFLSKNALRHFDLTRNLGTNPEKLSEASIELQAFILRYPENILATGQLASLYRYQKKYDSAEETLNRIPKEQWGYPLHTEYGRLLAAEGKCEESKEAFTIALSDRDERNVSRIVFDLAILYAGCFQDSVRAKEYFTRYLSYPIPEVERQRAFAIAKQFIISLEKTQ